MKLTLDEFLKNYPLEEKYGGHSKKRIEWFWSFDLKLSIESLWVMVSDSSKINQAINLPAMEYEEKAGMLYGKSKIGGIKMEWIELPWVWDYGKYIIAIREYSLGLAKSVKVIFHFEKLSETETRFYVYFAWVPNGILFGFILRSLEKNMHKKYILLLKEYEKMSRLRIISSTIPLREKKSMVENQVGLSKIREELIQKKFPADIVNKLLEHIEFGNELDLYRIRVLELANQWDIDKRELLLVCMHAVRHGLLTISWDVICPHCRGTRLEKQSLYDVPIKASCEICEVDFENDTENSIEITFHIHPSIRNVPKVFFCSAEPAKKPHIKLQKILQPNETMESNLKLGIGRYKLRVKGKSGFANVSIDENESTTGINWKIGEDQNFIVAENPIIQVVNTEDKPQVLTIEDTAWNPFILKPAYLFSLQEFHDLFSAESLSSDLKLELGLQTIFFTDIVGSSTLYENQGDSKTFIQVKKHFEEINKYVNENEGAIIKTIGDAVMATFPSPKGALQTSLQLCKIFDGKAMDRIRLRISMHYGNCIAVNLNSGIDYFGKTVNVAAKIQKLAGASQIVFTNEFKTQTEVETLLDFNKIKLEELKYSIPGMKDEYTIYRINAG